jgi:hypothetical protein
MAEILKSSMSEPLSYRDAGVDIDAGDALVEAIKPFGRRTLRPEVLGGIGGFGALCEIPKKIPAAGAGLGHRRRRHQAQARFAADRHGTIGIDLVAMSVNDILIRARSRFSSSTITLAALDVRVATEVVKGIAKGCELAGCALIGGETAESPACIRRTNTISPALPSAWPRRSAHRRPLDQARRCDPRARFERPALQRLLAHPQDPAARGSAAVRSARADADLREADPPAHRIGAGQGLGAYHRRRLVGNVPRVFPPGPRH